MPVPSLPPAHARASRLAAILAVVAMIVIVVFVIKQVNTASNDPPRNPFDPTTTDAAELRRVAEAVSRIIASPVDRHEPAVQTLEAVRAESAGARDLKEACTNTYRGMIRAEQLQRELLTLARPTLVATADGGRPIPAAIDGRMAELMRRANEQVEIVQESKDRCLDLYGAAVRQLGLVPASRPSPAAAPVVPDAAAPSTDAGARAG